MMKVQIARLLGVVLVSLFAFKALASETLWIDVRSLEEYQADHIEGHINIPHARIAGQIAKHAQDKNTAINLYCRSGRRAGIALQTLETMGYTRVSNIGGIADARTLLAKDGKVTNSQVKDAQVKASQIKDAQ